MKESTGGGKGKVICIISLEMLEIYGPGCCTAKACSYLFLGQANISELPKLEDADRSGCGREGQASQMVEAWREGGGKGEGGVLISSSCLTKSQWQQMAAPLITPFFCLAGSSG